MPTYIKINSLEHSGIKGMKWGVRRFQNEDGTLTAEGIARYGIGTNKRVEIENDAFKKASQYAKVKGIDTKTAEGKQQFDVLQKQLAYDNAISDMKEEGNRRYDNDVDAHYGKQRTKLESAKNLTSSTRDLNSSTKNLVSDVYNPKVKRMDLSKMTDQEMRERINRERLERDYDDLFNPEAARVKKGKQKVAKFFDVAGDILGVTGAALAIALTITNIKNNSAKNKKLK